jgi:hypothetical protein
MSAIVFLPYSQVVISFNATADYSTPFQYSQPVL